MTRDRWIAIWIAFAVLAFPALSLADHHKAGGKAEEHRSEKAAENSNAQWDDDNDGRPDRFRRGDDDDGRPDRLRRDRDDEADDDDKDKREKREKKNKKEEKGKKDRKGSDSDD